MPARPDSMETLCRGLRRRGRRCNADPHALYSRAEKSKGGRVQRRVDGGIEGCQLSRWMEDCDDKSEVQVDRQRMRASKRRGVEGVGRASGAADRIYGSSTDGV